MVIVNRFGKTKEISIDEAVFLVSRAEYVHWYDALPAGDLDNISVMDLSFPAFLDAVPRFKSFLSNNGWNKLSKMLVAASTCLSKIPSDVPLTSWADTPANRVSLNVLFESCMGQTGGFPGIGPACCTKLLHKKRPALLPIIDSWQLKSCGYKDSGTPLEMVEAVYEIKKRMESNLPELLLVQEHLINSEKNIPDLSLVRIYDILFWEISNEQKWFHNLPH